MDMFRRKERMDHAEIEALAGLRPLFDPVFDHLYRGACKGLIDVYFAAVPMGLIRPFDPDYDPGKHPIGKNVIAEVVAKWSEGVLPQCWVYQKGDHFVLSDDYIIWEAAKVGEPDFLPCWILGKPISSELRDVQGPVDQSDVAALLGPKAGSPMVPQIRRERISLRPMRFPLSDEAAFWSEYPQQPAVFRNFVADPGIFVSVPPESAKTTDSERREPSVKTGGDDLVGKLPTPPKGYFWSADDGGMLVTGWRHFRLWHQELGYMPHSE
jgi:hypothetical protein